MAHISNNIHKEKKKEETTLVEKFKKNPFLWGGIGGLILALLFQILGNVFDVEAIKVIGIIFVIVGAIALFIGLAKATKKKADSNRKCKKCGRIPEWETVDYKITSCRADTDKDNLPTGYYSLMVYVSWTCPDCGTANTSPVGFTVNRPYPCTTREHLPEDLKVHLNGFVKNYFDPTLLINVVTMGNSETTFSKIK